MRRWLFTEVTAALAAVPELVSTPVLEPSSLGLADTPSPSRPFVVLRSGLRASEPMPERRNVLSRWPYAIWAHDDPGSFLRVDNILLTIRKRLAGVNYPAVSVSDGIRILELNWEDDSEDLFDDGLKTATKWSGYTAMTRETETF